MNSVSQRLASFALTRALSRPCGARIPRSGKKGAAVNCFTTYVDKGDDPYLWVQGFNAGTVSCLEWDGSGFSVPKELPLSSFELNDFKITHYYGLAEVSYVGLRDFALDQLTKWPYIKIHTARTFSSIDQYWFNKKKLIAKERKGLLKFLVTEALEGEPEHELLDLMTSLYSIKWFSHPQGKQAQGRLEFYLDSLVETGELRKANHKYVVTGKALQAIEEYEEQERKHTENVKIQWRAFWLAAAVAALTVVQAGLIKLPPVLDFSTPTAAQK
jgi:hypothetical protein